MSNILADLIKAFFSADDYEKRDTDGALAASLKASFSSGESSYGEAHSQFASTESFDEGKGFTEY